MRFGICTILENAAAVKASGWDYLEESVQGLLQGLAPDAQWQGAQKAATSPLPVPAGNMLVPASLKITGPNADPDRLRQYIAKVVERAEDVGMKTLVFGSGGARQVPEGFDRDRATQQIIEFARTAAEIAWRRGVIVVIEPLNRQECNIINTVAEAIQYVREVGHPGLACLLDSYHSWIEAEPLNEIEPAVRWIKHVHVADKQGRVPPGESGTADYRPLFRILKAGGYDSLISVEANFPEPDIRAKGAKVLDFLKRQWQEA